MSAVDRSRLPEPGVARPFHFPAMTRAVVGHGLAVRAVPHEAVPVVSIVAVVPGGSSADPADRLGLAAFGADLLDDGAGDLDGAGISDVLARMGADLDLEVWADAVVITITAMARHLERALRLMADLLIRPRFADADIERVRALRLDRLRQMRAQAQARADRAFVRRVFGGHPYGHHGIGDAAGIQSATADEIRAFHAAHATPAAVTLVVGGAVAADLALRLAEHVFDGWTPAPPAARPDLSSPTPAPSPAVLLVPRTGAPQSELRIGQVGVPRTTPDYHALVLWNAVFGGQFVSRLNHILREQKGYTYGVRSAFEFRRGNGPFSVQTSVQASATADAVLDVLREAGEICGSHPPSPAEVERAKAAVGRGYPLGFETAQQVARGAAQLALHGLPDDHFARFVPTLYATSEAEVTAAGVRHVRPTGLSTVIVGDPATVAAQFEAAGVAVEITGDEGF